DVYKHRVTLDFSANVNPFGTPEPVKAAICAAAEDVSRYPDPYCTALREKLAAKTGVLPDEILCGNGAAELIFSFVQAVKPKTALLPVPSFAEYETALRTVGVEPVLDPLSRDSGFVLSERILDSITPETDVLLLCSPNNPTGRSIGKELLLKILDRCRKTGTWLFLDECFQDLTDADKAFSLIGSLRDGDRALILKAFTKTYGMAGVRLGYAISKNRDLLRNMSEAVQPWNVSTLAQSAGLAALDCPDWAQKARDLFRTEKAYLMKELSALGVFVLYGDANFLLLSGVPTLYERLLERGILVRDCANFRGLEKGDVRIAVRTHAENAALIAAITEALHA
ncbi:MAG: aminotransferase class I/II-fold pyridoxal phosphate-dependent enzyme, partial [Clostridia bacterium]|nr:aminotransferase class I/II-fold pyridoxal phosphate-dependent enzyme [Clostridia bacterium]